uniref:Uncharacterized protein n=1 Tax=Tanacetum cinerariifolium TaxID=118510 RepID=A0A699K7M3_TANCI|nr:hypothetical protein [Tanacetum cinerariifolium]
MILLILRIFPGMMICPHPTTRTRLSCFQSQPDFHKPDEDFSCSKWKEYSSLGLSSIPFLSPLIHSSMGEFGPAHRP